MWYLVCILVGFVFGYIVKDLMPADIQYKGKFKQKGTNNVMTVENKKKRQKRCLFRRKKDNKKELT